MLAINEFREFLNFYPTHTRAHYAQFKLAMAYFYQMRGADARPDRDARRDPRAAGLRDALPGPAADHRGARRSCARRRTGSPTGTSASRSTTSASSGIPAWSAGSCRCWPPIPSTRAATRVFYYLGESLLKIQRPAEALPYFERLVKEFEQSEYLEKAKLRITELKALPAAAPGKGSQP